ncbi:MAG: metal-dependent phosphoesterase [Thermoplasmata archaeon]|nr:MAG: metal-dependent phosphoesterase [Thermoplasmata archaeon]
MEDDLLKIDLHVHSAYSEDAKGLPKEIIKYAIKKGLNGLSITDHNSVKGSLEAMKIKPKDFIIIPGIEISTREGHLIALGIKRDIERDLPVEETIELIIDEGGVPIVPHLFRTGTGLKRKNLDKIKDKISAIEVFNSCSMSRSNRAIERIAKKFDLGGTGGSDAHEPSFVGYGYTTIDNTDLSIDSLLSEIERKRTWGYGEIIPLKTRGKRMIKSVVQFFERGLRRI